MGNAITKEDIREQLEQMKANGIGGVEQITMPPVYEKGGCEYPSPEYFELLSYAVEQAGALGLEFSVNFGGPGWIWGGQWVPKEDQSANLISSMLELEGPQVFSGPLSDKATINPRDVPRSTPIIAPEDRLVKVVAGRVERGRLRADSLVDLSGLIQGRNVTWQVPEGKWQLMGFWMTQRNNADAVNHLDEGAMSRYCERLGEQYVKAIGEHLGKTVESFFSDSFEVPTFRNGIYWADSLFARFQEAKGYDLTPLLPALWWEVDDLSPKIRYDVNHFLHEQGMRAFFNTFLDWCKRHNVKGRIQPYGFVTDNIEGAGKADIPEMEVTPGEKDAVPWFDNRIGVRDYVASGAHLYGRNVVTVEAFTYLHWDPYRATLEELKAATDGFLRAGANKFYNHGFLGTPETGVTPNRGFYPAIHISPDNTWWPYYKYLAEYAARSCWLLRQGQYVSNVAVYSPLANQWTLYPFNARKWTREFEWGPLGQLLVSNGYGYDLVNDDVLQHRATMHGTELKLGEMNYEVLILPEVESLPLETMKRVETYVKQGGVVIALEWTPEFSVGLKEHETEDAEVKRISSEMFDKPTANGRVRIYGQGRTHSIDSVLYRDDPLDWQSAPLDPFLKLLRQCAAPDMDIDLIGAGLRNNEGLGHIHRRSEDMDIYFLSNAQYAAIDWQVGLRTVQGQPYEWDANTGGRKPMLAYRREIGYTWFRLSLEPFASKLIVFERGAEVPHVIRSDFAEVIGAETRGFTGLAVRNGVHTYEFIDGTGIRKGSENVCGLPADYEVAGKWTVQFAGEGAPQQAFEWDGLLDWTDVKSIRHFSGKAHYSIDFKLPTDYFEEGVCLQLNLGAVGNVGDIRLNGKPVGVHLMNGQTFSLDNIAQAGKNTLEVDVTNVLINRVSGWKSFPEIADELKPMLGRGLENHEADRLLGFEPLPRTGLLGPVRIIPSKELQVKF